MRPVAKSARLVLGGLILAAASQAAEPFYVGLMEAGSRDYLRGDYPAAAHKLQVACFGLLDEPQLLTRGLIRLALAQAGAGDDRAFASTFDRLLEVEAAFGSYSRLPANTAFKTEFERLLPERFTAEDLASIPAFDAVVARMREAKLAALPPKRLRKELQRRLDGDPADTEALVLLTRLEIAQDHGPRAEQRLIDLLETDPSNRMARCLHGQMKLRREDCAGAMEDLSWCSQPPTDQVLGARYLRCLVEAADWQAAGGFLASLPLDLRSREEVANLVLAIPPETLDDLARASDDAPETRAPEVAASPEPAAPPVESGPTVFELRRRLAAADGREAIDGLFDQVAALADDQPVDTELQYLAAEIAYLRADHPAAVRFFRRGGLPDLERPLLRFYFAVGLFETGEPAAAAEILGPTLPMLEPTPFVERYRDLILSAGPAG